MFENVKQKVVEFEAKHKIVPKAMGACAALTVTGVSAAAAEGDTVDISTVTNTITTELTSLVSKVAVACAAVVGVGLTIFGIRWAVIKVMSFFRAIAR